MHVENVFCYGLLNARLVATFYYNLMKKLTHLFATEGQNPLVLHLGFMYYCGLSLGFILF